MTLSDWASVGSLVAAVIALGAVLRGSFMVGKLYQQFEGVVSDVADLKFHRHDVNEKLTTILARCKMCVDEGGD